MAAITKQQIRRVYALGAAAGILESGNQDDNLHVVVRRISGKDSVSSLTGEEFIDVERELLSLTKLANRKPLAPPPPKTSFSAADAPPGMMNKKQQRKAWALIYDLIELDHTSKADAGKRMCGAIKKILGVDARLERPFEWITFAQGIDLIEKLKRYVSSATYRAKKRGS